MQKVADLLVALVPDRYRDRSKMVMALVLSVLTAVSLMVGAPAWVAIVLALLTAPVVYGVPNEEYEPEHAA